MRKKIVGVGLILLVVIAGAGLILNLTRREHKNYTVVASNFVAYDFARAVTGDASEVKMLLSPGAEAHHFEPTPEDIMDILNADLFIYNGGESEEWVEEILRDNEVPEEKTLKMMELVEVLEEEHDGDEHEHDGVEYDEHIWTSPKNAMILVSGISRKMADLTPERAEIYAENSEKYVKGLMKIDESVRKIVEDSPKDTLIFGDRFPFLYFVREYGLQYAAAFPGCSEQTEASSGTIAQLIDKARELDSKVILKIELTSNKIAQAIADEVGGEVMTLSAAHNISKEDFDKGVTYLDIWGQNLETLAEALK